MSYEFTKLCRNIYTDGFTVFSLTDIQVQVDIQAVCKDINTSRAVTLKT